MEENPRSLLIRLVDELLNHIKCRFKPAYKKVWKIVSPENGICTNCGETVYNDKGIKNIWLAHMFRIKKEERIVTLNTLIKTIIFKAFIKFFTGILITVEF